MILAPPNWNTYLEDATHKKEYRITISEQDGGSPETYGMESIQSATIEAALFAPDMRIGNAVSRKLTMTVLATVPVPRMGMVTVECRLASDDEYTDYVTLGTFWVDERDKGSLWRTFVCYDAMLMFEQAFIDAELEDGEWPIPMVDAVAEICARAGVELDEETVVHAGTDYVVPYTNDLTMREVLGYIAACHGGNWTITSGGKLKLVVLQSPSGAPLHVLGNNITRLTEQGEALTISKITMYDDAENAFASGDDTGYHLEVDCPYATQGITDALCNTVDGILYNATLTPFEAEGARLNPLAELGDDVSVGGIASVLNEIYITLGTHVSRIGCPGEQEIDHEYPYLSSVQRMKNRTVKLDANYFGTSISRKDGIKIERSDGKGEAVFNSDAFAMRALDGELMADRVYFDPVAGNYVFDGILSAGVVNALSAVITPNLYAGKATISELTVDQLDTSTKVQKYLNEDSSDVNYIRIAGQVIQFVTASVASIYGAGRTSSGSWDMTAGTQTDIYYSGASIDDATGAYSMSGGRSMDAYSAYNAGRIYRAIDTTSYYKLTGISGTGYVYYDVYTIGGVGTNYEQAKNRDGSLLYWTDDTHVAAATEETAYPVYVYLYNELVKMEQSFETDGTDYVPKITLGAGSSSGDEGKGIIWKDADGLTLSYLAAGEADPTLITMTDFVDAKMRRVDTVAIDKTGGTIDVTMEGESTPVTLTYTETATSMTITWPDSHAATISIS